MTQNPKNPPSGDQGRTEIESTTITPPPVGRTILRTKEAFLADLRIRAKTSRACAVKLFCLDCVGGVRADIRDCTAQDCALYPHRPYQVKS